jgi:hypothetical protein
MALSETTHFKLASALKDECIKYIQQDQRYADLMFKLIEECIKETLGTQDKNLVGELEFLIFDKINLV